jgi:hypothetical protein
VSRKINTFKISFKILTHLFILPFHFDSIWVFKDSLNRVIFVKKENFSYVSPFVNGVARFNINGKCNFRDECEGGYWGIIDYKGNIILNNLEWIGEFVGNYAIFQKDYKFGLLRKDGRIILPAKLDEIIIVDSNFILYRIGNNWGIVNSKSYVLYEVQFNSFIKLNDSLFLITKGGECDIFNRCEGSKFGIINKNGNFLVPLKFDGIGEIKDSFVEVSLNDAWGLMKLNGKLIIDIKYEDLFHLCSYVFFKENGKWGLMDLNKKILIKPKYEAISRVENANFIKMKIDEKWGLMNCNGKEILKNEFDNINYLGDGYFLAEKNNLKGVFDSLGKLIIDIKYKDISYSDGKFILYDGDYWEFKNIKFNYLEFVNGLLLAKKDGFFGIIDTNGIKLLDFYYDSIKVFNNFILSKKGNYWTLFNTKFEEISENIDSFVVFENFLKFRKFGKWGLISKDGNLLLDAEFDYIDDLDDNKIIRIVKDGYFGLFDLNKGIIVKPKYKFIYRFYKNVYKLITENSFNYFIYEN